MRIGPEILLRPQCPQALPLIFSSNLFHGQKALEIAFYKILRNGRYVNQGQILK